MLSIDKKVELPSRNSGLIKYPFGSMEVGDSFLLTEGLDPIKVAGAAWQYGRDHKMKFSVRKTTEGHRCWRVK